MTKRTGYLVAACLGAVLIVAFSMIQAASREEAFAASAEAFALNVLGDVINNRDITVLEGYRHPELFSRTPRDRTADMLSLLRDMGPLEEMTRTATRTDFAPFYDPGGVSTARFGFHGRFAGGEADIEMEVVRDRESLTIRDFAITNVTGREVF